MKIIRRSLFLVAFPLLLFHCAGPLSGARTDSAISELPVSRVILYQNGVGYFERKGRIDSDVLELQVRESQINDLLKSLTVVDFGNGRALSVSLPLEKTGGQILDELPEQVRNAGGLLDVLRVFRGAHVEVFGKHGAVAGRIVGVEEIAPTKVEAGQDAEQPALFKATFIDEDGALITYEVDAIEKLVLKDRNLEIGLEKSLDVSLNGGSWKPSTLSIHLTKGERHDVAVSYIIEMPKWKPAYRIMLSESEPPLLQGWAVVDNVSGEDWNDVELSLVAGTPMSFIYDLHTPQFTPRVDLTPRSRTAAVAPVIEQPGYVDETSPRELLQLHHAEAKAKKERSFDAEEDEGKLQKVMAASPAESTGDMAEPQAPQEMESAPPDITGAEVGALFRYDLTEPVTVPDRSSTLVSIVNARVPGKEILLFRPELSADASESYPYRAVMLKNEAGFTLESGPVAAYAADTFVGEGFLERMAKDMTAFLTFSVDKSVSLTCDHAHLEDLTSLLRIIDGQIITEMQSVNKDSYTITNRYPKAVTAFVKTARRLDATLRNRPQGTVETGDALYLPVEVGPDKKEKLVVEWVSRVQRTVDIESDVSTELLRLYMGSGRVPPEVARVMKDVLSLKTRLTEIDAQMRQLEKQQATHSADQERVRENLNILRKTKGNRALQKELASKLGELEAQLGKISGQLVRLSEDQANITAEMGVLIRSVTLDNASK